MLKRLCSGCFLQWVNVYSRIRFIRHSKGPKNSDEYAGVTNKPDANIMHLNGRATSRDFKNAKNMPVDE